VFDRGASRSIYLHDPDGHVVEIATRGPGFAKAQG
jgi:catechol-2,3-dioxygenase